jgi:hypothetical protein
MQSSQIFYGLCWTYLAFLALSMNIDLVDLQINLDNPQPLIAFAGILWPYSQLVILITTNLTADLGSVLSLLFQVFKS